MAIGAGGSGGSSRRWRCSERSAVVAGAGRCSVGGSGCEQARWKWKRKSSATGESGSAGEAGLGQGSRARLGEGEDDLNLKEPSPPLFIKVLNSRRVILPLSLL